MTLRCDLASLGAISDVEELIERETKGSKAVRCRFCRVPLELVLNISNSAPLPSVRTSTVKASAGVLSHEAFSGATYFKPLSQSHLKSTSKGTLETREMEMDCTKSTGQVAQYSGMVIGIIALLKFKDFLTDKALFFVSMESLECFVCEASFEPSSN